MKRLTTTMLIVLAVVGVAFAGGEQEESTAEESTVLPELEMRYAHSNVPIYFYHTAGEAFGQRLAQLTDDRLTVSLFPQGQLGGERDVTEGLQLGTIDFQATSIGVTGTFIPAVRILNLPFLFQGPQHFLAVMNGPLGGELLARAQEQGEAVDLKVLGIAAPDFRIPMSDVRPINAPDDFSGMRIRTMEVPTHIDAYRALGANPVPLPFGELYTALQTDVVDANENGPLALFGNRFYEVQRYVTLLPVVSNAGIFLMSKATWDALPAQDQEAVLEAAQIWIDTMNSDTLELGGWAIQQMENAGIQVNQVGDVSEFVRRSRDVYPDFFASLPDNEREGAQSMVERIQAAAEGVREGDWFAR